MDLQGSNSNWVYAYHQGSQLNSDDTNAIITQHDRTGNFQWDISRATGGSETNPTNPFADTEASQTTPSTLSGWQSLSRETQDTMIRAHGILAFLAFVILFPLGALLIRLASFRLLAWTHGGLQIFAFALFIAAAGLGIYIANGANYLDEPHAVIGLLLLAVLFFMPILGTVHHKLYKRVQKRTVWSYAHIFTGRVAILLGIVNGGLGLQLADASRGLLIGYGVFAGVVAVVYTVGVFFGEVRRERRGEGETTRGK